MPDGCAFAWLAFLDLDRWRGSGGFGPNPLTLADLDAWERRMGVALDAETVELVKLVDGARLASLAEK